MQHSLNSPLLVNVGRCYCFPGYAYHVCPHLQMIHSKWDKRYELCGPFDMVLTTISIFIFEIEVLSKLLCVQGNCNIHDSTDLCEARITTFMKWSSNRPMVPEGIFLVKRTSISWLAIRYIFSTSFEFSPFIAVPFVV